MLVKLNHLAKPQTQLISFDMDVIKKAGLVTETLVIITNQDDFQADVEGDLPRDIKRGDALMIAH